MFARADHQRHEIDAEPFHHRHGEQKHHRRAVHGEDLVVEIGAEERGCPAARAAGASARREQAARAGRKPNAVTMIAACRSTCDRRRESQPIKPGRRPRSRRARPRSPRRRASRERRDRGRGSLKRLQIGEQRLQIVGRDWLRRHLVARLDAPADRRSSRRDVPRVFGSVPAASVRPARRRASGRARPGRRPASREWCGTSRTARHEDLAAAALGASVGGSVAGCRCGCQPRSNAASVRR